VPPGVGAPPSTVLVCGVVTPTGRCGSAEQQLQLQGAHVSPGAHAGQAQAQPGVPGPLPLPASTVVTGSIRAHEPVGHGAVMHSMLSEIQPQEFAVSAAQDAG
jgi:hypothetical protein